MASVQGPLSAMPPPDHHRKPNRRSNFQSIPPDQVPSIPAKADPYYGHEYIARLSARFITHLFACPEYPPSTTVSQAKLPHFIAYALYRTKLHVSVTFAALVLLQRLKARFPTARGSSGHRLFISAFMIASKVICDDTYSNKSWSVVAQGMFTLREINQMEREMCTYLDWELTVDNPILGNFEKMVKQDFHSPEGPYPTYSLQMVSKRAAKAASSASATPIPEPSSTTSPIPMFDQRHASPSRDSPLSSLSSSSAANASYPGSPMTPDTPSASYSNSTSPASSASPATPIGMVDYEAKIHESPLQFSIQPVMPAAHPLKNKMFAFAAPSLW